MSLISVYPADDSGCGNYRLRWPGEALAAAGHDVVVNRYSKSGHGHTIPIPIMRDATGAFTQIGGVEADTVVIQRPATGNMLKLVLTLQERGHRVVVDVDDALWAIHPDNYSYRSWNTPVLHPRATHWQYLLECMEAADTVVATTHEIAKKVRHSVIVPNFIPESMLAVGEEAIDRDSWSGRAPGAPVVVGWAAWAITHPRDPDVTFGHVADWVRANDREAWFLSVGGRLGVEDALFGFTEEDHDAGLVEATGIVPVDQWASAVSSLDISLVPLEDTMFNRAKSRLKMLESAAVGCAVIASPTPDNLALHEEHGVGVIAKDRKWARALNRVVREGVLEHAVQNYHAVQDLTIEANAQRWLNAWEGTS